MGSVIVAKELVRATRDAIERFCIKSILACGLMISIAPSVSFAGTSALSTQIKEEETQLAKRFAVREAVEPTFEYSLGIGRRVDNLDWSVAIGDVNVASEVSWSNTVISQFWLAAKVNLGGDWFVRGQYAAGAVASGSNRDSDYAGAGRTQEYSRSDNKTGGSVGDFSIGFGKRLYLRRQNEGHRLYVAPAGGLSFHQQNLTMYDGRQSVPFDAPLANLDSSYEAQWKGPWIGADVSLQVSRNVSLDAAVEYHRVDYSAQANWNLRDDFEHPVSFEHDAKGSGRVFSAGLSYRVNRNFLVNFLSDYQKWSTSKGSERTYFSYGTTGRNALNPVHWSSKSLSVGVVYQF